MPDQKMYRSGMILKIAFALQRRCRIYRIYQKDKKDQKGPKSPGPEQKKMKVPGSEEHASSGIQSSAHNCCQKCSRSSSKPCIKSPLSIIVSSSTK